MTDVLEDTVTQTVEQNAKKLKHTFCAACNPALMWTSPATVSIVALCGAVRTDNVSKFVAGERRATCPLCVEMLKTHFMFNRQGQAIGCRVLDYRSPGW